MSIPVRPSDVTYREGKRVLVKEINACSVQKQAED